MSAWTVSSKTFLSLRRLSAEPRYPPSSSLRPCCRRASSFSLPVGGLQISVLLFLPKVNGRLFTCAGAPTLPEEKEERRGEERVSASFPALLWSFGRPATSLLGQAVAGFSLSFFYQSDPQKEEGTAPKKKTEKKRLSLSLLAGGSPPSRVFFAVEPAGLCTNRSVCVSFSQTTQRESGTDRNNGRKNKRSSRSGLKTRRRLLQPKQTEVLRGRERKRKEEEESAVGLHVWARYAPPAFLDIG